jgi:hypothetical protein
MASSSRPGAGPRAAALRGARLAVTATALGCAGLLLAACSGSSSSNPPSAAANPGASSPAAAGQPGSGSGSGSNSGTAAQAGLSACATPGLRGSIPAIGDAASGHTYYPLELTNDSSRSCTLYGYPGVSFVSSAAGGQIGSAAARDTPGQLGDKAAQTVTLRPGQTAHAVLELLTAGVYSPSACGLVFAHWLRVYPPGETAPLYLTFTAQTCSKGQNLLTVGPVQPVGAPNP